MKPYQRRFIKDVFLWVMGFKYAYGLLTIMHLAFLGGIIAISFFFVPLLELTDMEPSRIVHMGEMERVFLTFALSVAFTIGIVIALMLLGCIWCLFNWAFQTPIEIYRTQYKEPYEEEVAAIKRQLQGKQ